MRAEREPREYWELIDKITDIQNDIERVYKKPFGLTNEELKYIEASRGLICDIYEKLYDMGHTKEEIDRDVAYN